MKGEEDPMFKRQLTTGVVKAHPRATAFSRSSSLETVSGLSFRRQDVETSRATVYSWRTAKNDCTRTLPVALPPVVEKVFSDRKKVSDENKLVWIPETEVERRVYAALILAGKPVTNGELAALMEVSKSQASKDVAALSGHVQKRRIGREVRISLPHPIN